MENKLKNRSQFEKILKNYTISDANKLLLKQTSLVVLTGPSSSGRNTLIRKLESTGSYHFIVSDTTRHPRSNDGVMEKNGVEYWFKSEADFLNGLKNGEYLEAEIIHGQQVSGISMAELQKAHEQNEIAITDMDIGGIQYVTNVKPDAIAIAVLPPTFEEWLTRVRGRNNMPESELRRRMKTALHIFAEIVTNDRLKIVVSRDVDESAARVHQLARFGEFDNSDQQEARNIAEQLYIETKLYIDQSS